MNDLNSLFGDPNFQAVVRFFITLFGATCMYVFSLNRGFEGSVPFLKKMLPNKTQVSYDRIDFFIVNLVGSVIGTLFYSPTTALAALAAGFGWVGAINVLLKPSEPAGENLQNGGGNLPDNANL